VTLIAEPAASGKRRILVDSDGPFRLRVLAAGADRTYTIRKGRRQLSF
jgi:hypothetical protein